MGPCHWLASSVIEINPWQKTRHLKLQVMTMRTEDRQRGIFSFCSVLTAEINDLTGDYSNVVQKSVALCVKSCLDMSFFGIFFSPFSIVLWFASIQYSKFLAALSSFLKLAILLFSVLGKPYFASIQYSKLLLFLLSLNCSPDPTTDFEFLVCLFVVVVFKKINCKNEIGNLLTDPRTAVSISW